MFAEPISITINGVAKSFSRVSVNAKSAQYQTSDGLYLLNISHQMRGQTIRSVARLEEKRVVADPLTAVNDYQSLVSYYVTERPNFGFSATDVKNQVTGFNTWYVLTATQDKIIATES